MKIDVNSIRVGDIIEHQDKLFVVLKTMHTQPGKGGAYMQVEMKDIANGIKINIRYRSSEVVEKAFLEQTECQFLYEENSDSIVVMDNATYDQFNINKALVGDKSQFLKEGLILRIQFYNDAPVLVTLPETVNLVVCGCESAVKGQTAASSYKPAILENGVRVMVPAFIEIDDVIVVKIDSGEYVSRVNT